jgi:hypothetical protein
METRLWDLGENTCEELEDVEGLSLGIGGEGVVVRGLALIEECFRTRGRVSAPRDG